MELTRVGLGTWAIGGGDWAFGWGAQDDADSIAAIRRGLERGINWIDTAAAYGLGHSEELVGRALRQLPDGDRPYVFTKCGLVWDEGDRRAEPQRSGDPARIRSDCDASLRRLGLERIDLFQIHWPPEDGTPLEEAWQAILDLVAAGKVRAGGVSNFSVEQLERCERRGHIDSAQPPFSLINRAAAADVIPWCAAHETGVIVYSPMGSGLLTGGFNHERAAQLGPDDWRSRSTEFREPNLSRNLALADALRPLAERHGVSAAAIAVAWAAAWPGLTGAIVGARTPEQVEGWLAAAELELAPQELEELSEAIERTGAGSGPSAPPR